MVQSVDGKTLAAMLVHASASLNAEKQKINELNVFPVPDGDTGTNMGLTLGTAAAELRQKAPTTAAQASALCASAMLRGARGNSGVILSLIFRGFSRAMKDKDTMDGIDLADALNAGVVAAYKAVMKPAEGTVLTVSRLAGDRAGRAAEENTAFEYVLGSALERAREALADTVNQNPVLKKAGVVDAGGMGFVVILQGMLDELHGIPAPADDQEPSPVPQREKADFGGFETGEIQFGYCTEFICSRDTQKDPEALRAFLNGLGDSLVLVDDDEIIKVHVHTNHPGKVLEEALTYGGLLTVKVENMRQQQTELLQHLIPNDRNKVKAMKPVKTASSTAWDDGLWQRVEDLRVEIAKDTDTNTSLFSQIKKAFADGDFDKASNLQVQLNRKMEELEALYTDYLDNMI